MLAQAVHIGETLVFLIATTGIKVKKNFYPDFGLNYLIHTYRC